MSSAPLTGHLRGVSAASLEAVLAALETSGGSPEQIGNQLFGVVSTLDGTPALRRILTDPSTEADAKAALAASVFGAALAPETLDLVSVAVRGRWSAGRDLADGLQIAGVAAQVGAADDVEQLENELFAVGTLVTQNPDLRSTLADTVVPGAAKAELIGSLVSGKISAPAAAIVAQAAQARSASFERTLDHFAGLVAARRGRLLANVRTATPLGAVEHDRLAAALAARYGREVHLNVVVDPAVIGGLSVSVADDVIDGTMSSRLEAARRRLAG